ncbi:MAG: TlpA family protein disulfide reductase, partial [Steroidobacteraceae bacterium]
MLKMGRRGRWAFIALLAVAAGVAAFFVSREVLRPEMAAPPPIQLAVIPEYRPDVTLADRDGKPRALAEWDGRPLIINFWATWCAP